MAEQFLYATIVEKEVEVLIVVCHNNKPYLRYVRHGNVAAPLGLEGPLVREAFCGILAELEFPQDTPIILSTDRHEYFSTREFVQMLGQTGIEITDSDSGTETYKPRIFRLQPDYHNNGPSVNTRPQPQLDQGGNESQSDTDMVLEQTARYFERS